MIPPHQQHQLYAPQRTVFSPHPDLVYINLDEQRFYFIVSHETNPPPALVQISVQEIVAAGGRPGWARLYRGVMVTGNN